MFMGVAIALSAIAGFCLKFADEVAERKIPILEAFAAAFIWGILSGFITVSTPLSSLFIAIALASLLAGKVDHLLHWAGLLSYVVVVAIFPLQFFDAWLFSLFLIAALLDELSLPIKAISLLASQRLWLPTSAAIAGIWLGNWFFLFAIIAFDIGYRGADYLTARIFRQSQVKHLSGRSAPQRKARKKPKKQKRKPKKSGKRK